MKESNSIKQVIISGKETPYLVSETGIVWDKKREMVIKQHLAGAGYKGQKFKRVYLHESPGKKYIYVQQLVAEAFLGPCPNGHKVHHLDSNRWNNSVSNLSYMTVSQIQKGIPPERWNKTFSMDEILEIRALYEIGIPPATISRMLNKKYHSIFAIVTFRTYKHPKYLEAQKEYSLPQTERFIDLRRRKNG